MASDIHHRSGSRADAAWMAEVAAAITDLDAAHEEEKIRAAPESLVGSPVWERTVGWLAGFQAGVVASAAEQRT